MLPHPGSAFVRWLLFACLAAAGSGESLLAQATYAVEDIPTVAEMNGFVFDPTGALGAKTSELAALLGALADETAAQGGVFVLPSIGEHVPKDFAVELFERQELGYAGTDFGFLVLLVLDQRRAEIETGYGLEGYLTDLQAKRLLERAFVPLMKEGQAGAAVLALARGIDDITRAGLREETSSGLSAAPRPSRAPGRSPGGIPGVLLGYLVLNGLFHLLLGAWLLFVRADKISLYDKYVRAGRAHSWWYAVLFPVPYLFVHPLIGRWMRRLRTAPRFHPETKEPMTMLSEYDEIPFLDKGSLTEQEVKSAEWDVWATASRANVQLLRYGRRWTDYGKCPSCEYQTYKLEHTEIIAAATYDHAGLKRETSRCKACAYEHAEERRIAQKQHSGGGGGGGSLSGGGGGGGSSYSGGGGRSGGGGAGASW